MGFEAEESTSSISTDWRAERGDGGGVFSNLTLTSSRLFGNGSEAVLSASSECARFSFLLGGGVSLESEAGEAMDAGEFAREFARVLEPPLVVEARFAAAAARAAWVTGRWMPSEGRESDLRRVLYGMMGERERGAEGGRYE